MSLFWCDFPCVHRQKCEGWDCPVKGMAQPPVVHYALRSWFRRWKSTSAQWEFQDPKMEVLYHILGHMNCGDIPWSLGLMVGTSNLGSWNGHWSATPPIISMPFCMVASPSGHLQPEFWSLPGHAERSAGLSSSQLRQKMPGAQLRKQGAA